MVIYRERGADLHMAQLMPLPLTVSCFSKIQIGFTFLVPAHPGSPGQNLEGHNMVVVVVVYNHCLLSICHILVIRDPFQQSPKDFPTERFVLWHLSEILSSMENLGSSETECSNNVITVNILSILLSV